MKYQILLFLLFINTASAQDCVWAVSAGQDWYEMGKEIASDKNGNVFIVGDFESPTMQFGSILLNNHFNLPQMVYHYDTYLVKYNSLGNVLWGKCIGDIGDERVKDVTTDPHGNVYVTGTFTSDSLTFGNITIYNFGNENSYIVKYDPSGNVSWVYPINSGRYNFLYSITSDKFGNIFGTGGFSSSTLILGNITLNNSYPPYYDIIIFKADTLGNIIWAKTANGDYQEYGKCIAADDSGNVIIGGIFNGSRIIFDTTFYYNWSTYYDIFLVKCDPAGNILWIKTTGNLNDDIINDVDFDDSGNAYITGNFEFDPITFGLLTLQNNGMSDLYMVKYDKTGNELWAYSADCDSQDFGDRIIVDSLNNVFLAGKHYGTLIIGTDTLKRNGSLDTQIYLSKFDNVGNPIWAKTIGGNLVEEFGGIAIDQ